MTRHIRLVNLFFKIHLQRQPRSQGLSSYRPLLTPGGGVTVIWVSPCFGYPRTQIPSVLGIPSRDTQNTESVKYHRLGQVKSCIILLKNHLYSYEALSQ